MERHKCKICSRSFSNGRALGGHMRSHLATLPIPPKIQQPQLGDSASSLSSSEEEERESEEKLALVYGLRENPKRSFRLVDPEFLDAGSVVVQDRESETESTRTPTRRRSKRTRKMGVAENDQEPIKNPNLTKPSSTESMAELEPVSSVSDTSPEEDVALCLMMLSRDSWSSDNSAELRPSQTQRKYQCETCSKVFRSFQALGGHQTSHKKIKNRVEDHEYSRPQKKFVSTSKVYECPFCEKVFGSGQAFGGHKRSHFLVSSSSTILAASSSAKFGDCLVNSNSSKFRDSLIDLNLPAPIEDEDFNQLEISVVSDN